MRRADVAASGSHCAAPVGACQGICHFIRFFVVCLSFVFPFKYFLSKAMATVFLVHLIQGPF